MFMRIWAALASLYSMVTYIMWQSHVEDVVLELGNLRDISLSPAKGFMFDGTDVVGWKGQEISKQKKTAVLFGRQSCRVGVLTFACENGVLSAASWNGLCKSWRSG